MFEITIMIRLLQPWHVNLGKRLVKRPKLYFNDSGLLHALIGITDERELMAHPQVGASWEGFAMDCVLRGIGKEAGSVYFRATYSGDELDLFCLHRKGVGV